MKKRFIIILSLVFCLALTTFVSCSKTKSYTVSFNTNCEMQVKKATVNEGKEYTLPQAPDRGEGWEFQGWYADSNFSGEPVTTVKVKKNLTFYAKWEQLYNLTLDLNGGSLEGATSFYLKAGEDVNSLLEGKTPTKAGCVFGAWVNGNSELAENFEMPESNVSLVAKYKVGYTLKVYKQNTTLDGYDEQTFTFYDYAASNFTVDYSIEGFVLAENDDAKLNGELKENPAQGDNVFVAYYDRIKYSLQLNSNYPNDKKENENKTYELYYGLPFNLRHDVYSCSGYFFSGWTAKNSEGVDYSMDYIDTLLYNSTDKYEGIDYYPTRDITLYACWTQGYTDMFGGIDTILLFEDKPQNVYLVRGGKYFKGEYDSTTNEFLFISPVSDETIAQGKILGGNAFCYGNKKREGYTAKYYSVEDGINDKIIVHFGLYNDIEYRVIGDSVTDVSKGTYEIQDSDSAFVVTFTEGSKKDTTLTFMLTQASSNGSVENVFIERNEEEYALGKLVRFLVTEERTDGQTRDNYFITAYNDPYYTLTLSGYGVAVYYNGTTAVNCYYVYDAETAVYQLIDTSGNIIGYAKYMELYGIKGYMFYSASFDNTFTDTNGATLKLDGTMNAEYETEDEIIKGYYTLASSYLGGYLVTIKSNDNVYKFIVNVVTEGEGDEKVTTYVMESKLPGYTEYYYYIGDQQVYAPILVLDGSVKGEADLYSYTSSRTFEKANHGTYSYDESTGLYVYNITETYPVDTAGNKFDLENVKAIVFDLFDGNYRLYYMYSYTVEGSVDEVTNTTVYTPSKESQSQYKLTLVAGFAILSLDEDTTYTAMYTTSNGLKYMAVYTNSGSVAYIYFETDEENKTFLIYDYSPFTAYVYREDGTASSSESIVFDGKGGAVYTVDNIKYSGTVASTDETIEDADAVMTFTGTDGENTKTFRFILRSTSQYVFFSILSDRQGTYSNNGTTLSLDGTGFNAVYTNENGETLYTGMYRAYSDNVVYIYLNDEYVYFELDYDNKEFILLGNEIGQYLYVTNGGLNDLCFTLDGKGNLYVFRYNDDKDLYPDGKEVIDANGTYAYNSDGEMVFNFVQGEQKTLTGRLSTITVSSNAYKCFFTNFSEMLGVYVNEVDNSVLYLDDVGNAILFLSSGGIEAGSYTIIADGEYTIFYYVNSSSSSATLYEIDVENKLVSYVNSASMAYYNENLSSLQFTQYGFAIFNGESRYYFYVEDNDDIVIYHRANSGEEENVNKYGFVKETLGKFDSQQLTYNGVNYYINDGYALTFNRKPDSAATYPVQTTKDGDKFPLESLTFTPTGADEFSVVGNVVIGKDTYSETVSCNVVREVVKGTDGNDTIETYILIGYYRFDINISYSYNQKSCQYEITRMRYLYDANSYLYTYYYYLYSQYYGQTIANMMPQIGHITVWKEFNKNGISGDNWIMSGTFYQSSGVWDVEGNPIEFENVECALNDSGYFDVKFTYKDGSVYNGLFNLDSSLGIITYKMPVFVRVQTFEFDEGNTVVEVSRIISADDTTQKIPGELAALSIKINGEEVTPDAIYKIDNRFAYIVREKNDDGKILSTTYYYVKFVDDSTDIESNVVKPYSGAELEKETLTTYQSEDGNSYVDIDAEGNVVLLHTETKLSSGIKYTATYLPESTTHVEGSNEYIVTLKTGKKFKVTITEGVMSFEEIVDEDTAE